jgi:hypothetical protein
LGSHWLSHTTRSHVLLSLEIGGSLLLLLHLLLLLLRLLLLLLLLPRATLV